MKEATITITVKGEDAVTAVAEALFNFGIGADDERDGEEWVNMRGCDYRVDAITCSVPWVYGEYNRDGITFANPGVV